MASDARTTRVRVVLMTCLLNESFQFVKRATLALVLLPAWLLLSEKQYGRNWMCGLLESSGTTHANAYPPPGTNIRQEGGVRSIPDVVVVVDVETVVSETDHLVHRPGLYGFAVDFAPKERELVAFNLVASLRGCGHSREFEGVVVAEDHFDRLVDRVAVMDVPGSDDVRDRSRAAYGRAGVDGDDRCGLGIGLHVSQTLDFEGAAFGLA